jgi:hypothetical protein
MIYYRKRVIFSYLAFKHNLLLFGSFPWLINELFGEILELGNVFFNVKTFRVIFFIEADRRVDSKVLMKKTTSTEPLPISIIECPICIEKEMIENVSTDLPILKKMPTCKKASN